MKAKLDRFVTQPGQVVVKPPPKDKTAAWKANPPKRLKARG